MRFVLRKLPIVDHDRRFGRCIRVAHSGSHRLLNRRPRKILSSKLSVVATVPPTVPPSPVASTFFNNGIDTAPTQMHNKVLTARPEKALSRLPIFRGSLEVCLGVPAALFLSDEIVLPHFSSSLATAIKAVTKLMMAVVRQKSPSMQPGLPTSMNESRHKTIASSRLLAKPKGGATRRSHHLERD